MKNRASMKIKVCGMRDPLNLEQVCELDPDYVGFIFYAASRRFVGIHPDPALFGIPGPEIKKTGVFVDEDLSTLRKTVDLYGLEAVQLHGAETPEYCEKLSAEAVEVIKVLDPRGSARVMESYTGVVDLFLFDSAGTGAGGSGHKFDWNLLRAISHPASFLLSGGIGPGDAGQLGTLDLKGFAGVDVNSRFERLPGIKDVGQLQGFIHELRK